MWFEGLRFSTVVPDTLVVLVLQHKVAEVITAHVVLYAGTPASVHPLHGRDLLACCGAVQLMFWWCPLPLFVMAFRQCVTNIQTKLLGILRLFGRVTIVQSNKPYFPEEICAFCGASQSSNTTGRRATA